MNEERARHLVFAEVDAIDPLTDDAFLVLAKIKSKWYIQLVQDPSNVLSITTGGFQDESEARTAYQKALLEGELTPYRALAQKLGEVIELELVGGYARVLIESNNAFFVFMVKSPYEVVSLCDNVGMAETEARVLYNSFPDVLRGWPLLQLRQISAEQWGTESGFVCGMMYIETSITIGGIEFPGAQIGIFAWSPSDGEVRFLPPERLDEAMEVFASFLGLNMKKVFERPTLFTPPAPESAERME